MTPIEPGDSAWPARKARLLERVHARGEALHRRAQVIRGLSVATALLLLAAVPGALAASGSGGGNRNVRTIGRPSTSTSEEPTTTAEPVTTTTVAPAPTTAPHGTTTTLVCRNSTNPACGPFRWDPPPGPNSPLTVQVTYSPSSPKAGETVTFHVVVDDPDAKINRVCNYNAVYGDGSVQPGCGSSALCAAVYGPWTPPARVADHYGTDFQHTYATAGTYTASFSFQSTSFCYPDPYGSQGSGSATVTVQAGP